MTLTTKPVSNDELNYRDDRDIAFRYVDNFIRRIKNQVDAQIKKEHTDALLEGREVQVDLSRQGVKRMIAEAAVALAGGVQIAIGSSDGEDYQA